MSTPESTAVVSHLLTEYPSLADYLGDGGGRGLERARAMQPEAIIDEVTRSGLRGRGGAGFPTGVKWATVRAAPSGPRYVICNAAEGEPATFKDRLLIRHNPYQMLEGVVIACLAVGAPVAYVGLKDSFARESTRVATAISEMREAGMLGSVTIELVLGPDRYLFGEETGLVGVIEGRGPFPRVIRPFMQGPFATSTRNNPAVENNAETLANVPGILTYGPDWLRSRGTPRSPGSMLFTVCGDVEREGVFELPFGVPFGHLLEDLAGARDIRAIIPGASSRVMTRAFLDTPLDFDAFRAAGSGLGAGGFAVYDSTACMVGVARAFARFLYVESCGQCPSCKRGGGAISEILDRLERGEATQSAVDELMLWAGEVTDGQKCALPTGQEQLTLSMLAAFPREFEAHVADGCASSRRVGLPKIVDFDDAAQQFVYDQTYELADPQWGPRNTAA